jgi:hypothetical protein
MKKIYFLFFALMAIGSVKSQNFTKVWAKFANGPSYSGIDYWWFNNYYNQNNYNKLESIGMDINFNKYSNHGIELRFLDHITDKNKLFDSFEFIIYLMDHILDCNDDINNPIINKTWNNFVLNIMIIIYP